MEDQWVVVHVVQGEIEERQIVAFLQAHGLTTAVAGEALRKTHAFVLDGLGEVTIRVPAAEAEAARELLERAASGDLALEDDELVESGD